MWKDFKEFAVKGNVVDMAVGIMIGAAFGTVVKSLVDNVLMPPIGLATGGLDFTNKFVVLRPGDPAGPYATIDAATEAGATVLGWGLFVNSAVSFGIIAVVLFFIVRWANRLRRADTPAAPNTRACPYCKSSIDIAATKCPFCTSEVEPEQAAESPAVAE
jgi:large conductance mechanosensitive channel